MATLITQGSKLSKQDEELLEEVIEYRKLVGSLQYLTMTRLDICYVVDQASQFL